MDMFRTLSAALLLTLLLSPAAIADEAQDKQVEIGVKAYDDGDYQRAKDILLPLAETGHPKAMNMVGLMHDDTTVFPNDPVVKCDWYERSASAGYMSGMYNLSTCFNHGIGRSNDKEQMLIWRTKAAELGYIPAMINLAGMDQNQGEHYRRWMNKAVKHGSKYAQVSLWLQGYKKDVPEIRVRDIFCVSLNILILDGDVLECD